MKKFFVIAGVIMLFALAASPLAKRAWIGKTLSAKQVAARWGTEPFDGAKFKSGDYKIRAKMAWALMGSKVFVGKGPAEIRESLGPWDGYLSADILPAYIIWDGRLEGGDSWQIVFLLDKSHKTTEIVVNRN